MKENAVQARIWNQGGPLRAGRANLKENAILACIFGFKAVGPLRAGRAILKENAVLARILN